MASEAASAPNFKSGSRVRLLVPCIVDGKEVCALGDQGVVEMAPVTTMSANIRLDNGGTGNVSTELVEKLTAEPWGANVPVKFKRDVNKASKKFCKAGDKGVVVNAPEEKTRMIVKFDSGVRTTFSGKKLRNLEIVDEAAATPPPKGSAAPPAEKPEEKSAVQRQHNRWGDGLDAPAAGAREFFPNGWTPSKDVFEAVQAFGHADEAISKLRAKGEQLEHELGHFGLTTASDHASAVFAYTQEDPVTDLYGKLNSACRTSGGMAERRLAAYRDYIHHLQEALTTLPTFRGRVFRGTKCRVSPDSYAVGKKVTWQAFASTSKSQQVARGFVGENAGKLDGSFFVLDVKSGIEVDALSAYPMEQEVLLKVNTFLVVTEKVENEAAKKSLLGELAAYGMAQLDVYVMKQL